MSCKKLVNKNRNYVLSGLNRRKTGEKMRILFFFILEFRFLLVHICRIHGQIFEPKLS